MPGTIIREKSQRFGRALPTDTGVGFLVGPAERGATGVAHKCRNMTDFVRKLGNRQTNSLLYDMAEAFFGEAGGSPTLYVSRLVGPAPVIASRNLLDGSAGISLVAKGKGPGAWYNQISVGVVAGDNAGEFKIRITAAAGVITEAAYDETSLSFVTQNDAVEWSKSHEHITLELGASALDPSVAAPAALTGGADDFNNISDATALVALNAFTRDLGPGQVAFAGRTTAAAHGQLKSHGEANNRRPIYDPADTTAKSTLVAAITATKAIANARIGAMFGPWLEIPALVPGGQPRPIPPSAAVMGVIARNEGAGASPNQPHAGDNGILQYATGIRSNPEWTEADLDDLNNLGFNVIRNKAGDPKIYGWRSATNKVSDPLNWQWGNQRLFMAIAAQADNILERFVLRQIDGRGLLFRELQGQLSVMLDGFGESLYGDDPQDKYLVDVETVNTPTTIANGEIHAAIELTMSPMGETVILDITKRLIAA